jgi:translation elongation factor EF-1beta
MSPDDQKITRDQIEAKLREVTGGVTDEVEDAKSQALAIGLGVVVLTVAVVFLIGRRAGRRKSTIVEVRRI